MEVKTQINALDDLIAEAERIELCFNEYGWPETFRALLAVAKAARKECREHRASVVASTIRSAMNQAAWGEHGH